MDELPDFVSNEPSLSAVISSVTDRYNTPVKFNTGSRFDGKALETVVSTGEQSNVFRFLLHNGHNTATEFLRWFVSGLEGGRKSYPHIGLVYFVLSPPSWKMHVGGVHSYPLDPPVPTHTSFKLFIDFLSNERVQAWLRANSKERAVISSISDFYQRHCCEFPLSKIEKLRGLEEMINPQAKPASAATPQSAPLDPAVDSAPVYSNGDSAVELTPEFTPPHEAPQTGTPTPESAPLVPDDSLGTSHAVISHQPKATASSPSWFKKNRSVTAAGAALGVGGLSVVLARLILKNKLNSLLVKRNHMVRLGLDTDNINEQIRRHDRSLKKLLGIVGVAAGLVGGTAGHLMTR